MVAARSDHICVLKKTLFYLMYFLMYFREQECFFFLFQSALQNATYENGSVAYILRVNIFFDCSCCNSEIVLEISLN